MKRILIACCALLSLTSCQSFYDVSTNRLPEIAALNTQDAPIPGKFAVQLSTEKSNVELPNQTFACSPVGGVRLRAAPDFQELFSQSLNTVLEEVELVAQPLDQAQLKAAGYTGFVSLQVNQLTMENDVRFGGWQADIYAKMTFDAELVVVPPTGPVLQKTLSRTATGKAKEGGGCIGVRLASSLGLEQISQSMMIAVERELRAVFP